MERLFYDGEQNDWYGMETASIWYHKVSNNSMVSQNALENEQALQYGLDVITRNPVLN